MASSEEPPPAPAAGRSAVVGLNAGAGHRRGTSHAAGAATAAAVVGGRDWIAI